MSCFVYLTIVCKIKPFLDKAFLPFWKRNALCQKQIQASTVQILLAQVYELITLIKAKVCNIDWGPVQARNTT